MPTTARNKVLLHGEETAGAVSIVENRMPAGAPGPPLHSHAFDEAFYVLDRELTVQLDDQLTTVHAGELIFARRGVPHTLANLSETPTRFLLVLTPPGFEREFARASADCTRPALVPARSSRAPCSGPSFARSWYPLRSPDSPWGLIMRPIHW
jgi:quercetin dioxygenase-like cupin family protein